MHECLRLYDTALALMREERAAFDAEDESLVLELAQRREEAMREAWAKRAGCDPQLMRRKLDELLEGQKSLANRARMETDTIRMALKGTHKETARLTAYGKSVGNAGQSARIMRKEG